MIYEDRRREQESQAKALLLKDRCSQRKSKRKARERKELRNKRKALGIKLDSSDVIKMYVRGIPVRTIADKYCTTPVTINKIINNLIYSLVNVKTASMLEEYNKNHENTAALTAIDKIQSVSNDPFLSLLSPPHGELTEAEKTFCVSLVYEGDYIKALESAGLAEGIINNNKIKTSYSTALASRRTALENKPNTSQFITELRGLVSPTVNKEVVQKELMDMYLMLKNRGDRRDTNNIIRTLELIGRTEGVFSDRVQVEEVSASSTLDKLIAEAEEANIIEIDKESSEE